MILLYKILKISAWLLILATVLTLFTGLLTVKYFLLTGIDYRSIHTHILPWIFIPIFYVHSSIGLINLLSRHKSTNKKSVKTIFEIIWAAVFVLLVLVVLAKAPAAQTQNNNNNNSPGGNIQLTLVETAKHNSVSNCWLIINNKIYDVTNFLKAHPGGVSAITPYCGKDATQAFDTKGGRGSHSSVASNLLNSFYIGDLGGATNSQTIQNVQNQAVPNLGNENESEND